MWNPPARSTPCLESRCHRDKTDEDYVLGLLRATGVLCVYGSGFGTAPGDGFLRIVFLASLTELADVYDAMADFYAPVFGTLTPFTPRLARLVAFQLGAFPSRRATRGGPQPRSRCARSHRSLGRVSERFDP